MSSTRNRDFYKWRMRSEVFAWHRPDLERMRVEVKLWIYGQKNSAAGSSCDVTVP